MARVFGELPGIPPGTPYTDRKAAAKAGVHRPPQGGISGSESEGADSIVVSGGYQDDEDHGNVIIYTGHGGHDPASKTQIAGQVLAGGNLALAVSSDQGLPVRVLRGAAGDPAHSPVAGYRYDGLFDVESYWQATGLAGHVIWRFRLVRQPAQNTTTNPSPAPAPGPGGKAFASVQRTVRNTAVTQWVKELYAHKCQVCGTAVTTSSGPYAEGAHLRPVGSPHKGPDSVDNVLCLCPNDHVRVDRGAIGFDPLWNIVDIATGQATGKKLDVDTAHNLNSVHAAYHRTMFP